MKHWRLWCRNGAAFELGREWPVCAPASTAPPRHRYTRATRPLYSCWYRCYAPPTADTDTAPVTLAGGRVPRCGPPPSGPHEEIDGRDVYGVHCCPGADGCTEVTMPEKNRPAATCMRCGASLRRNRRNQAGPIRLCRLCAAVDSVGRQWQMTEDSLRRKNAVPRHHPPDVTAG